MERIDLNEIIYVDEIAYNARGQRALIVYGNGVMTRYAYDEKSFRLQQMRSELYEFSAPRGERRYSVGRGAKLQDLHYAYDAVGNIHSIESRGVGLGIEPGEFAYLAEATWGSFSADSLLRRFEYDPLYRLTRATGRERKGVEPIFWGNQVPGGSSVEEARPYIEHYSYDKTGGLVEKRHEYALDAASGVAQWKQTYQTDAASNRLVAMGLGGESRGYVWDGGENLMQENSERHGYAVSRKLMSCLLHREHRVLRCKASTMPLVLPAFCALPASLSTSHPLPSAFAQGVSEWDHAGRLRAFRVQAAGSPASSYGAYGYDGAGQRVQKVSIRGGVAHATVYIDGIFEHHQIFDGSSAPVQANELHVMDDASRVASWRVGPDIFNAQKPAVLYELGDHLGSSSVVVSETGGLISREEYRPYGESSFGSYAKKRFRFTGKERDEESGLYYHGARYYSPWLCRWTAPDPAGMVDGVNVYAYVRGNPVRLVDPGGMEGEESQEAHFSTILAGQDLNSYPQSLKIDSHTLEGIEQLRKPSVSSDYINSFWNARWPQVDMPGIGFERSGWLLDNGQFMVLTFDETVRVMTRNINGDFRAVLSRMERSSPVLNNADSMNVFRGVDQERATTHFHTHPTTNVPSPTDFLINVWSVQGLHPRMSQRTTSPGQGVSLVITPDHAWLIVGTSTSNFVSSNDAFAAMKEVYNVTAVEDGENGPEARIEYNHNSTIEELRAATGRLAQETNQVLYMLDGARFVRVD